MGSVRTRPETGKLVLDFTYCGERCREQTALDDTGPNRKRCQQLLKRIDAEITLGTFDYARHFPNSTRVKRFELRLGGRQTPRFEAFACDWLDEQSVAWRDSHATSVRSTLERHLIPRFGNKRLAEIMVEDVSRSLSAQRINHILTPLKMILQVGSDRWGYANPANKVKRLRVPKIDVFPLTLEEIRLILDTVRPAFRNYYAVRFFTGMRTGEVDGLQWRYVDFDRRLILVRETLVRGRVEYTKTDGSQRDIQMSSPVYEALRAQHEITGEGRFVFCTDTGAPLNHNNVTKRIWYPILRHLGFEKRRPYQTRHTAATLWLAAGESPEWIARQLGHTSTEMLFRRYSRFVPNLTRQDGSAFEALVARKLENGEGAK